MDEILEGHYSYDYYSFFYIEFYPCKNTTENNNKCQPIEIINYYLNNTFICFEMEDVQLTPITKKSRYIFHSWEKIIYVSSCFFSNSIY